jgi:hypothetical protein
MKKSRASAHQTSTPKRSFTEDMEQASYNNWSRDQMELQSKTDGIIDENEVDEELERWAEENGYNNTNLNEEVDEELERWAHENGYNDNAGLMETSIQLGLCPEGEALLLDEGKSTEGLNKKPIWSPLTLRHTKK